MNMNLFSMLSSSPGQLRARRVIRPVGGDVAVDATLLGRRARAVVSGDVDVSAVGVTLEAEEVSLRLQHAPVVRTVRVVTRSAVLSCRRVLPQEWSALVLVT